MRYHLLKYILMSVSHSDKKLVYKVFKEIKGNQGNQDYQGNQWNQDYKDKQVNQENNQANKDNQGDQIKGRFQ